MTNDMEAVLREIMYWHRGSLAGFKIMYRDEHGVWDAVSWDGEGADAGDGWSPETNHRLRNCKTDPGLVQPRSQQSLYAGPESP